MNERDRNEALWRDAGNWYYLNAVYWCPEDPRVWVPKRAKWTGWTLNFAHRAAWWWLMACLSPAIITVAAIALTAR